MQVLAPSAYMNKGNGISLSNFFKIKAYQYKNRAAKFSNQFLNFEVYMRPPRLLVSTNLNLFKQYNIGFNLLIKDPPFHGHAFKIA